MCVSVHVCILVFLCNTWHNVLLPDIDKVKSFLYVLILETNITDTSAK